MSRQLVSLALVAIFVFDKLSSSLAQDEDVLCSVALKLESGCVCGTIREAIDGTRYRSFRGIPYAKQPLGELRFQELQPVEPWEGTRLALEEGPICPQHDVLYGRLMTPRGMSEACIHANVHIPDVPQTPQDPAWDLTPPYGDGLETAGLPILVMIHGGGFAYGSGDADLHGPERLVSKDIIVVTFNYRLNVFGFLSLGSAAVPGNQGLRDMVSLLRWVRDNARAFGGNPDDVTLMGQSAGAAAAHILSLSPAAKGLFRRAILMSGTALPTFYPLTPNYAAYIANMFLNKTLDTPTTDPDEIHQQLINMPIDVILEANKELQAAMGITAFSPVIEPAIPGLTRIIDENTETSLRKGRGKDIPLLIGHTNVECEIFRPAFEYLNVVQRIEHNNLTVLPAEVVFSNIFTPEVLPPLVDKIFEAYFEDNVTTDKFVELCSHSNFQYPALKVAQYRKQTGGAPAFMYKFSYDADNSVLKEALGLDYTGAAHIEDLTAVFHVNSVHVEPTINDENVKILLTDAIVNFIRCDDPAAEQDCTQGSWPPVSTGKYRHIDSPYGSRVSGLTSAQHQILRLFDSIRRVS